MVGCKWEYKIVEITENDDSDEQLLNSLGENGWELVTVATASGSASEYDGSEAWSASTAYLKRPKQERCEDDDSSLEETSDIDEEYEVVD